MLQILTLAKAIHSNPRLSPVQMTRQWLQPRRVRVEAPERRLRMGTQTMGDCGEV